MDFGLTLPNVHDGAPPDREHRPFGHRTAEQHVDIIRACCREIIARH